MGIDSFVMVRGKKGGGGVARRAEEKREQTSPVDVPKRIRCHILPHKGSICTMKSQSPPPLYMTCLRSAD